MTFPRVLLVDDNDEISAVFHRSVTTENAAAIPERDLETTIDSWMRQVERNEELYGVELD